MRLDLELGDLIGFVVWGLYSEVFKARGAAGEGKWSKLGRLWSGRKLGGYGDDSEWTPLFYIKKIK